MKRRKEALEDEAFYSADEDEEYVDASATPASAASSSSSADSEYADWYCNGMSAREYREALAAANAFHAHLAEAFVRLMEGWYIDLGQASVDDMTCYVLRLRDDLVERLQRFGACDIFACPEGRDQCAEWLSKLSLVAPGTRLFTENFLRGLFLSVNWTLTDVSSVLAALGRSDLHEVAKAGLSLARTASRGVRQLAYKIERKVCIFSDCLIEDLGSDDCVYEEPQKLEPVRRGHGRGSSVLRLCNGRYLWKPVRKTLRENIAPSVLKWASAPVLPDFVRRRPFSCAVGAVCCGPAAGTFLALALPPVLLADELLQRLYRWSRPEEVDEFLDRVRYTSNFGVVAARVVVKQSWRTAQRWLGGRTPKGAAADMVRDAWHDPVESARAAWRGAQWICTEVAGLARHLYDVDRARKEARWQR